MIYLQLAIAGLLPVIFSALFYLLEKKTKFSKIPYWWKQVIIGLTFGAIACFGTQFGVPTQGVVLNVRGAAPLTAGLIFGGPAGIIAGTIGAIYRYVSIYWGIGSYTVVACSLGTFFAGVIGACCRKFLFENKKTSAIYGLFISMATEVLHLLLVFITHMDDISTGFKIVRACALPMIIANGISVMLSIGIVTLMSEDKKLKNKQRSKKKIAQTFSIALLINVFVAFVFTSFFTFGIQYSISNSNAESLLKQTISDVEGDIKNASDNSLLSLTKEMAEEINNSSLSTLTVSNMDEETKEECKETLETLKYLYDVEEINILDHNGQVVLSSSAEHEDYHSNSDGNAQEENLSDLLDGNQSYYVQDYGPTDYDSSIYRKYAGAALDNGEFLQVGYGPEQFQSAIESEVKLAAQNRHIESTGFVMIAEESNYDIVSYPDDIDIEVTSLESSKSLIEAQEDNVVVQYNQEQLGEIYYMQDHVEGYIVMACYPVEEAHFYRDLSVYNVVFMLVVIFSILFVVIYVMIRKIIVNNLLKINSSLAKIAAGHLDTVVDVRDNMEFSSLSDDINSTVDTLKHYINDAEDRVHKELEFAKTIQSSCLPSVFPAYPNRDDFDVYAQMTTAKEVGGDFYDFYFVDENKFSILIADVSGKGVPAAMFMMTSKTMIKNLAETGMPIEQLMTEANAKLCEMNNAGMFVTVWMAMIDLSNGKMYYVSAGHNPPLIKRNGKDFEYLKGRSGFVLAGMEGVKYRVNEVQLAPSDTLFLYTDGVTEATNLNNELYGEDRLVNFLNSRDSFDVTEMCKDVLTDVNKFVGEAPQFDDITMLSFSLNKINAYNALTVKPDKESITEITSFVENWMRRTKVDERIIKKVNIIVDEIYSNIAYYSNAAWAKVHYTRDLDYIYLTFSDNGIEYNPLNAVNPDTTLSADDREIGGLGIMMVKKMASNIEYKREDEQNVLKITIKLETK